MSEEPQPSAESLAPPESAVRSWIRAALPFVVTAIAAVFVSLAFQVWLFAPTSVTPPSVAQPATEVQPPPATTPLPTPVPLATPAPTMVDESALRLDILDLQAEQRRLWSVIYLLRAVAQIDDVLAALQANDLDEADRTLMLVYRSLDRAYAVSAEQDKGPIDSFRLQISQLRDELRLRPEGSDRRLRQIRRLILSLVEA
ncbi:hypothetical protein A9Q02_02295 [Candidatus Chloroploca asiatica]|uniref:DUF5667 domain-containing protein n=1 Tax=Candidatus Chloroploca asiatica TaxID=1506545 RepID=A0A2H3KLD1_9CHLR|nr:hypothetical protein A9Q02_02295 [Candidatus Chloroploca asiatica]